MARFISVPDLALPQSDRPSDPGMELRAVRAQAALVRSLLDELESLAPPSSSSGYGDAIAAQTVEELTQLALRMLGAAATISPHSFPARVP